MEKVAQKVSQILKRPSQEEIPESALPPFKPLPKFQLQRESSLPRIEVDRPHTPSSPKTSLSSRPSSPYPQYQAIAYANTTKTPDYESNRGQKIPPNAKKLRVKSFLWVKPTTTGIDTALYNQVISFIFICEKQEMLNNQVDQATVLAKVNLNQSAAYKESKASAREGGTAGRQAYTSQTTARLVPWQQEAALRISCPGHLNR